MLIDGHVTKVAEYFLVWAMNEGNEKAGIMQSTAHHARYHSILYCKAGLGRQCAQVYSRRVGARRPRRQATQSTRTHGAGDTQHTQHTHKDMAQEGTRSDSRGLHYIEPFIADFSKIQGGCNGLWRNH